MMLRLNGQKDEGRRRMLERGEVDPDVLLNGRGFYVTPTWGEYRKRTTTFAVRVRDAFEVETLEGLHVGKPGDWLAVGIHGEMYPIDAAVFAATYEEVE